MSPTVATILLLVLLSALALPAAHGQDFALYRVPDAVAGGIEP